MESLWVQVQLILASSPAVRDKVSLQPADVSVFPQLMPDFLHHSIGGLIILEYGAKYQSNKQINK